MKYISELVLRHFQIDVWQQKQFDLMYDAYFTWNQQINVISRKDFENFYLHHVLHSLAISKVVKFPDGAKVVDVGCGGGFPGIPLAVLYPQVTFYEIDSIGKKIKVVNEIANLLNLKNVNAIHSRAEEVKLKADFVMSRAVADMTKIINWTRHFKAKKLLLLKGGDLEEEIDPYQRRITSIVNINSLFKDEYFDNKVVIEYDY